MPKAVSELTNEELLELSKKTKLSPTVNALFIGVIAGIIIYSATNNSIGFFTLIPLYFGYRLLKNSKRDKEVAAELKLRNLH